MTADLHPDMKELRNARWLAALMTAGIRQEEAERLVYGEHTEAGEVVCFDPYDPALDFSIEAMGR